MTSLSEKSTEKLPEANHRRAIIAGALGNIVEWFDWTIYGLLASIFSKQFFPADDPTTSLLVALSAFAGGYLMRPLGSILLSPLADRYGRKQLLAITIIMMGCGSLIIGLTPSYETIGVAAPIIVLLARLLQGFSAGGEFQGSTVFLVEHAPTERRAFYSSANFVGIGVAILLATGASALVSGLIPQPALSSWGWRIPFLLGAVFALYGFYIRANLPETPTFKRVEKTGVARRNPVLVALSEHPLAAFRVFVLQSGTVMFYIWAVFLPGYANLVGGLPLSQGFTGGVIALLAFCAAVPAAAYVSDRIGRKPVLLAASIGFVLLTYPLLGMLKDGSFTTFLLVDVVGCVLIGALSGVISPVFCELFPAKVRTSGIGVPYAVASVAFGATAPLIATYVVKIGRPDWLAFYIMGISALVTLVFATMPETRGRPLE